MFECCHFPFILTNTFIYIWIWISSNTWKLFFLIEVVNPVWFYNPSPILFHLLLLSKANPSFRWPWGLRHCHWLLAASLHFLGSNPCRGMWESCQWLGARRWFLRGLRLPPHLQLTSYPQWEKSDYKPKSSCSLNILMMDYFINISPCAHTECHGGEQSSTNYFISISMWAISFSEIEHWMVWSPNVGIVFDLRWIKTSGYETSRSSWKGWLQRIAEKSCSADVAVQLSL